MPQQMVFRDHVFKIEAVELSCLPIMTNTFLVIVSLLRYFTLNRHFQQNRPKAADQTYLKMDRFVPCIGDIQHYSIL